MGLFSNLRSALRAGNAATPAQQMDMVEAAGGMPAAEALLQQVVAGADVDPNDPAFAPFQGVDVDGYARVCKALVAAGPNLTIEQTNEIVQQHGFDPSKWTAVAEHWNQLVMTHDKVKMRYSATFISEA